MGNLPRLVPSWSSLLIIPGLIAGFTIHELAHALIAYFLGDLSQAERGRITLNPFRHISWFGILTFVFFGFGWAKPVQVDPRHFKYRYLGMFVVAIAGAAANLLLAGFIFVLTVTLMTLVVAFSQQSLEVILRLLTVESATSPGIVAWTAAFTTYPLYANLALAFFNLLPLPTLDGFTALVSLIGLLRTLSGRSPKPSEDRPTPSRLRAAISGQGSRQPADIHFERGAEYHAGGNYEDAIARYRQAIASDRGYGPAYVNLGLAYLALGQRDRAIHAFRGATQYAADEKSRSEAWAQLHKLSQFSPVDLERTPPATNPDEIGPWTDTRPTPNWLALGLSSLLTFVGIACVYLYLTIDLIRYLSRGG